MIPNDTFRILCVVVPGEADDHPAGVALAIAKPLGASVRFIRSIPPDQPFSAGAHARLEQKERLERRAAEAGVTAEVHEQHGRPAEVALLHAAAIEANLIVTGTADRHDRIGRQYSRANGRIARTAACPMLVVPAGIEPAAGRAPFSHLLWIVEHLPPSAGAVDTMLALSGGRIDALTIVHAPGALRLHDVPRRAWELMVPAYRLKEAREAAARLQAAIPDALRQSSDVRVQVLPAPLHREMRRYFELGRPDAIVFETSRGWRGFQPGRAARMVMKEAAAPVLLVPRTGGAAVRADLFAGMDAGGSQPVEAPVQGEALRPVDGGRAGRLGDDRGERAPRPAADPRHADGIAQRRKPAA
ncbi:MAG TPA: universal stress protein [Vicinamibacterales bacterium]